MPYKDPEKAKQNAKERYLKNLTSRKNKMKEDYRKNKVKRLEDAKRYAEENKEEVLAYQKQYRELNREKSKEYKKQYYQENRATLLEKSCQYLKENPEGQRKRNRKYRKTEKGKFNSQVRRNARRKREREASLNMIFHKEILEIYKKCKQKCILTKELHEVDHIVPISHPDVCGLHVPWNLQIIASKENREKSNKFDLL